MILFLIKGILRDPSRSRLPVIVVSIGVAFTVMLHCWITGVMGEAIRMNANFTSGHVRVATRAYLAEQHQLPNDLALLGAGSLAEALAKEYPDMEWVQRIRFAALADVPDSLGITRSQGPVIGWSIDMFSAGTKEPERMDLARALVQGAIPYKEGEALLSEVFAHKMGLAPGDVFTLFGTSMDGAMTFANFTLAGTVRFGTPVLDRGAILIDIGDARRALQMDGAASEVLGFFANGQYDNVRAEQIADGFNARYRSDEDRYAPQMSSFAQQEGMGDLVAQTGAMSRIMIAVFVLAMSVVLWNSGLLGGLRRYSEFGLRIALGESKSHVFMSLICEGAIVGSIGTVFGTAIGLMCSYFLQRYGLDIAGSMQNSSIMMPAVARAVITPDAVFIGFVPGILSVVSGNALAGIGIFRRQTAQLFKELEM